MPGSWAAQPCSILPEVANAPRRLVQDIQLRRHHLWTLALEALYRTQETEQKAMRQQAAAKQRKRTTAPARPHDVPPDHLVSVVPTAADITKAYAQRREETSDPTTLVIIDETDRLKTTSLEQVRDIFDGSDLGVVLLGVPGLEKRLSRYPQLYSRVGFVHAFRPLSPAEVRHLLHDNAVSFGVALPEHSLTDEEVLAVILRITGGNFRLLHRLLTQIARLVDINALTQVTREVVEAARECLVIGTT